MKRQSIFLDRKNQYCENDYTTKHNLQIQCNPCQITNGFFFTELEQKISQFIWNHKRPQIATSQAKIKNKNPSDPYCKHVTIHTYRVITRVDLLIESVTDMLGFGND